MSPLPPKPDKPSEIEDVEPSSNGVIEIGDSSSDNEDVGDNFGYELLPQEPATNNSPGHVQNLDLPPPPEECSEVSNNADIESERRNRIKMNDEQANIIKALMSNIQLPQSSQPSWADNISEDQWKAELISRINTPDK